MRIVNCAKSGRKWYQLAKELNIRRDTALNWITAVSRGESLEKKRPSSPLTDQEAFVLAPGEVEYLHDLAAQNPTMPLTSLHKALEAKAERKLKGGTVLFYLDNMIFRRIKKAGKEEGDAGSSSSAVLERVRSAVALGKEIIWVGEYLRSFDIKSEVQKSVGLP